MCMYISAEAASEEKQSDPPLMYQLDNVDKDKSSASDPAAASEAVETHNSSNDVFVEEGAVVVEERVDQAEQVEKQPLMYSFNTQSQTAPPKSTTPNKAATSPKQEAPHKEEEPVAIVRKDPGWYKQMFQQFQSTVEEHFPGGMQLHVKYNV